MLSSLWFVSLLLTTMSMRPVVRALAFRTAPFAKSALSIRGGAVAPSNNAYAGASSRLFSARSALNEVSKSGEFKRKDSAWRDWISEGREYVAFIFLSTRT